MIDPQFLENKQVERQEQFAVRLSELAGRAEQILPPDMVLCAMLSAALAYATRRNPVPEVIKLLRDAAERLESDSEHGVPH